MPVDKATAFRGWSPEALTFLRELEDHNDRDWFKANRARYDEFLVAPTQTLAQNLGELGDPRFFRPWNDTRFRPGPPLKEHIGVAFGFGLGGVYYVELSLDGLLVAAGMHAPASDQVERMRRAIDSPRTAASLTRALRVATGAGLAVNEPDLVRAPRGYPPDHPRLDLLRRRRLTVYRRYPLRAWLHRAEAGARIRADVQAAGPTVRWLRTQVGPSTA